MQLVIIELQVLCVSIYLWFGWRFWVGFKRTHFRKRFLNRLKFSLLWPIFYLTSSSFRRNFRRALNDDYEPWNDDS
ncbi:hypothetical protein FIV49_07875 [Cylindrospermopsis raciborskii GIHE 2018]|nr:hypothetical protein FIV49_07875 [Cylindrospermopsis raciborskii GIHE 2018]